MAIMWSMHGERGESVIECVWGGFETVCMCVREKLNEKSHPLTSGISDFLAGIALSSVPQTKHSESVLSV